MMRTGDDEMTQGRIRGTEVRTVITKSLEHFIETAPWRSGWPALELAIASHAEAAADVERLIQFNALMAENHIQSMISGLSHEGSSGPVLAARSALEAAGRACWLAESGIDDEERFRRALRSRHAGATQTLRLLRSFDRAGAGTPDDEQRLTAKVATWSNLPHERASLGRRRVGSLSRNRPTQN
jgi:hypothetical protein